MTACVYQNSDLNTMSYKSKNLLKMCILCLFLNIYFQQCINELIYRVFC